VRREHSHYVTRGGVLSTGYNYRMLNAVLKQTQTEITTSHIGIC